MTCRQPGELLGRAHELARLHASLEDAVTGRLQTVLCSGEPGIGKTALLDRFADKAVNRGARVLRAPDHLGRQAHRHTGCGTRH